MKAQAAPSCDRHVHDGGGDLGYGERLRAFAFPPRISALARSRQAHMAAVRSVPLRSIGSQPQAGTQLQFGVARILPGPLFRFFFLRREGDDQDDEGAATMRGEDSFLPSPPHRRPSFLIGVSPGASPLRVGLFPHARSGFSGTPRGAAGAFPETGALEVTVPSRMLSPFGLEEEVFSPCHRSAKAAEEGCAEKNSPCHRSAKAAEEGCAEKNREGRSAPAAESMPRLSLQHSPPPHSWFPPRQAPVLMVLEDLRRVRRELAKRSKEREGRRTTLVRRLRTNRFASRLQFHFQFISTPAQLGPPSTPTKSEGVSPLRRQVKRGQQSDPPPSSEVLSLESDDSVLDIEWDIHPGSIPLFLREIREKPAAVVELQMPVGRDREEGPPSYSPEGAQVSGEKEEGEAVQRMTPSNVGPFSFFSPFTGCCDGRQNSSADSLRVSPSGSRDFPGNDPLNRITGSSVSPVGEHTRVLNGISPGGQPALLTSEVGGASADQIFVEVQEQNQNLTAATLSGLKIDETDPGSPSSVMCLSDADLFDRFSFLSRGPACCATVTSPCATASLRLTLPLYLDLDREKEEDGARLRSSSPSRLRSQRRFSLSPTKSVKSSSFALWHFYRTLSEVLLRDHPLLRIFAHTQRRPETPTWACALGLSLQLILSFLAVLLGLLALPDVFPRDSSTGSSVGLLTILLFAAAAALAGSVTTSILLQVFFHLPKVCLPCEMQTLTTIRRTGSVTAGVKADEIVREGTSEIRSSSPTRSAANKSLTMTGGPPLSSTTTPQGPSGSLSRKSTNEGGARSRRNSSLSFGGTFTPARRLSAFLTAGRSSASLLGDDSDSGEEIQSERGAGLSLAAVDEEERSDGHPLRQVRFEEGHGMSLSLDSEVQSCELNARESREKEALAFPAQPRELRAQRKTETGGQAEENQDNRGISEIDPCTGPEVNLPPHKQSVEFAALPAPLKSNSGGLCLPPLKVSGRGQTETERSRLETRRARMAALYSEVFLERIWFMEVLGGVVMGSVTLAALLAVALCSLMSFTESFQHTVRHCILALLGLILLVQPLVWSSAVALVVWLSSRVATMDGIVNGWPSLFTFQACARQPCPARTYKEAWDVLACRLPLAKEGEGDSEEGGLSRRGVGKEAGRRPTSQKMPRGGNGIAAASSMVVVPQTVRRGPVELEGRRGLFLEERVDAEETERALLHLYGEGGWVC
uniref:Transmembrane protein n=1 Tax=Chromera velia CCMP2878 TaxID=1169474 RepID=A0A0G4GT51_9ALVE|eukprot:Cvel_23285.t1-p1 / transcript=Cvel_23285.t1 / gene=Cvel_23285 / organism=Chromera_velia_CCMP2878 / gene_product=hypothetical protein / transcript_product=hypothetical protein / location=Cvel_scaffold2383:14429-22420(+) / protein_length=1204 / sequence_SO=supercontig / SO=protein_coding / is_pseudo=false